VSVLHALWRRLPHRARREALFTVMQILAPAPDNPEPTGEGTLAVAGYFGASTGLGAAARRLCAGLRASGFKPVEVDLTEALRQGRQLSSARLTEGGGTVIIVVNGPMLPWALVALGRRRLRGKRILAHWSWELPILPRDWNRGFAACHGIWAPSHFSADAFRMPNAPPVFVCPNYVPPPDPAPIDRAAFGLPADAFVSLCVFDASSSLSRKNPHGAISAHRLAFGERPDRILVLKTHSTRSAGTAWHAIAADIAGQENIRLVDQDMPRRDLWALMAASDVVVSLHRAEGFGYSIAEAMVLGRAVVATGWSGNMDFMTGPGTYAVPHRMVEAHDPQATYDVQGAMWAEPDIVSAAGFLTELAEVPRAAPAAHFPLPNYAELLNPSLSKSDP
jgi:glycosyltransferase involved in cell wall biosynthesis